MEFWINYSWIEYCVFFMTSDIQTKLHDITKSGTSIVSYILKSQEAVLKIDDFDGTDIIVEE